MQLKSIFAVCLLCVLSIQAYASLDLVYQHWAGPIEEAMKEVQPGDVKHHSSYAMKHVKVAQRSEVGFKVEKGSQVRFAVLTSHAQKDTYNVFVKHSAEAGNFVNVVDKLASGEIISSANEEDLLLHGVTAAGRGFVFMSQIAKEGTLKIRVEKKAAAPVSDDDNEDDVMIVLTTDSPVRLQVQTDDAHPLTDKPLTISASLFDALSGNYNPVGQITSARLTVTFEGASQKYALTSNEQEGWVSSSFTPSAAGVYHVLVHVAGLTNEQQRVERSYSMLVQVSEPTVALTGVATVDDDESNLLISVGVHAASNSSTYIVYGELYGSNENGDLVPVCFATGMSDVQEGQLQLSVPAAWLKRTAAHAPYYLQNVRVVDKDSYATLARSSRITAQHGEGSIVSSSRVPRHIPITDELRQARPQGVKRVQGKSGLLVTHGYCANGNPFPTSHFTAGTTYFFNQPKQAISHDQFAKNLHAYAVSQGLTQYGIVAHSQGGAASLHLYTFYANSGLRFTTTGRRLIQSVGTPYQGTALAGILAWIGQIFGVGCGTVIDLTYNGATRWLSTIPTAARQQVFFHTTSFTDVWYRYDYCHLLTDLVLRDPDDGVTEQWAGQLPSGNNMGHKTGWCHAEGMRDPPQTLDETRNRDMNSNARR